MHAVSDLWRVLFAIKRDSRGAISTEYAFLIAFIAIVGAAGMLFLGTELTNYFTTLGNSFGNAASQS